MAPVLSPSSPSSPYLSKRLSSSSIQSLTDLLITASTSRLSDTHLPVTEVVREEGLRHAKIKLDARQYKKQPFAVQVLEIVQKLRVKEWYTAQIQPDDVIIRKVSGALTNAVFFVSCSSQPPIRTLLLRVYGSSSGSLISRPRELHVLHVLSSKYKIGPRVYGTFENGRLEEYFDSVTLTDSDIRDPQVSRWIGARMAELHSVDIASIEEPGDPKHFEIAVNVKAWLSPAKEVLKLSGISDATREELNLSAFKKEWNAYIYWATHQSNGFGSRRVFAHNDAQYGNLLKLKDGGQGVDEHRQIIVVDFEYAAPNPAAFDIANHFIEWCANYHGDTPHLLDPTKYPTAEERRNFFTSYIQHASMPAEDPLEAEALAAAEKELERLVQVWGPASHAGWAIWGIVQAREDIESNNPEPEFDYIGYAKCRMSLFRKEIKLLGVQQS